MDSRPESQRDPVTMPANVIMSFAQAALEFCGEPETFPVFQEWLMNQEPPMTLLPNREQLKFAEEAVIDMAFEA